MNDQTIEQLHSMIENNSIVPQSDADKLTGRAIEGLDFASPERSELFDWIRANLVNRKCEEFAFEALLSDYDRQFVWYKGLEHGRDFPKLRLHTFESAAEFIGTGCLGERCAVPWLLKNMPGISTDVNWSDSGSPFDELATSGSVSEFYDIVLEDIDSGSLSTAVFLGQLAPVVQK